MRQKSELRPYQDNIATFLYEHDEALCVARPGYGKTVSALTAFLELKEVGVVQHALVLAPKRVARNVWPDEIAEWAHTRGLRFQVLLGSPAKRELQLRAAPEFDLTIAGIDITQWLMERLDEIALPGSPLRQLLIIDEISRFRNPTGKRAKEVAKRAHYWKMIWGLTGTLRPSGMEDMFTPARIVMRGKLWGKSFYKWRQERMYPTDWNGYRWAPKPGEDTRAAAEIAPYIITPGDAALQLPSLTIVKDYVDLPHRARVEYDTMERKLFARGDIDVITAASAGVATGKLAQAANGFMYDNTKRVVELHDEKREWLQDLIEGSSGGNTLIVYEFLEDLQMIRDVITGYVGAGYELPYLGAGVLDRKASMWIQQWNAGGLPIMALHPASGGHGLNLQHGGADMAWLSPCWSPEYWEQTLARLHRSGQRKPVIARVCIARDTVDELKIARVHEKVTAQNAFEDYLKRRQGALGV